jgi:hypothetical protein
MLCRRRTYPRHPGDEQFNTNSRISNEGGHSMKNSIRKPVSVLSAITVVVGLILGASQVWAQQKAQTLAQQLVGTWTFVSGELVDPKGVKGPVVDGTDPKGQLIFTSNGRCSWQVIAAMPKIASNDRLKTTPDENKAVARGVQSIFGAYSVNEAEKLITIRVERSSFPNTTGTETKRVVVSITADELKISNPSRTAGGQAMFVWKRVK